ncbi:MAG: S8 family peptidase [Bacteroidota bacterium]
MKHRHENLLWALLASLLAGCQPTQATPPAWTVEWEKGTVPNQQSELVDGKPEQTTVPTAAAGVILQWKPGAKPLEGHPTVAFGQRYQFLPLGGKTLEEAMREYAALPGVQAVYPNLRIRALEDEYDSLQWGIPAVSVPAAAGVNASGVTVAVLDTGVDKNHPDLQAALSGMTGINYSGEGAEADWSDLHSHGTHVAGIIAATRGNALGGGGVANCKILPVKVLGVDGGTTESVMLGVKYAVNAGARVLNMSLGFDFTTVNPPLHDAFQYAAEREAVIVVAAGNEGASVQSPATDPLAIAVSSTSSYPGLNPLKPWEFLSSFSNRGEQIFVSAPGGRILSTLPLASASAQLGAYGFKSGTSMAAPFVSGVAALILAQHPTWSASEVKEKLRTSVDDLGAPGWDPLYGWGRVNALKAIN